VGVILLEKVGEELIGENEKKRTSKRFSEFEDKKALHNLIFFQKRREERGSARGL
jgi:hypothetical protein